MDSNTHLPPISTFQPSLASFSTSNLHPNQLINATVNNSTTNTASISPHKNQTSPTTASHEDASSALAEDQKFEKKYLEAKKEVETLESASEKMVLKIQRAKRTLDRLKFERRLLLDKLESIENNQKNDTHHSSAQIPAISRVMASHNHHSDDEDAVDDETGEETDASVIADGPKRKKPKKKDPNAPKKPANAFFMFSQNEREQIKSENPEISRAELTRALGAKWKSLSEDEKKKYYDLYEKDKERYATEMAEYVGEGGSGGGGLISTIATSQIRETPNDTGNERDSPIVGDMDDTMGDD